MTDALTIILQDILEFIQALKYKDFIKQQLYVSILYKVQNLIEVG